MIDIFAKCRVCGARRINPFRRAKTCPKCGASGDPAAGQEHIVYEAQIAGVAKRIIDMRDDKERRTEQDAVAGKTLGNKMADLLLKELIRIGRSCDYISSTGGGEYNKRGDHIRTREIGERLNQIGGNDLMVAANYRVRVALGDSKARELESSWGYIGNWLP